MDNSEKDEFDNVDLEELKRIENFLSTPTPVVPVTTRPNPVVNTAGGIIRQQGGNVGVNTNIYQPTTNTSNNMNQQQQHQQMVKPMPITNIQGTGNSTMIQPQQNKPNIINNQNLQQHGSTTITSSTVIGGVNKVASTPQQQYYHSGAPMQQQQQQPTSNIPNYSTMGHAKIPAHPIQQQQQQQQPVRYNTVPPPTTTVGAGPTINPYTKPPTHMVNGPVQQQPLTNNQQQQQHTSLPQTTIPHSNTVPTTTTTTTTGVPQQPSSINNQIQNHFNALALAYRNKILSREILVSHLETLFGKQYTAIYTDKIDNIPHERVPALPEDFNLQKILDNTPKIKDLALTHGKTTTVNTGQSNNPINNPNNNTNLNQINKLPQQSTNTPYQSQSLPTQQTQQVSTPNTNTTTSTTTTTTINSSTAAAKDVKRKKQEEKEEFEKQNIKDLNDVTKIANIDMKNETDHFLPDFVDEDENYTPEAEPLFLNSQPLRKKLCTIANRTGVKLAEENTLTEFISLACQDYLRTVLEFLVKTSQQRLELQKDDLPIQVNSFDVKKKLNAIEKREKDERLRKETEENERILNEAKKQEMMSKKKIDEKIPSAMREKINKVKMDQDEKARITAANTTALVAVRNIGKKKVTPMMAKTSTFPPVPSPQLLMLQQIVKEGKTLRPEQIPLYQLLNTPYEQELKAYHERLANQPPPTTTPMETDQTIPGGRSFLPPSTLDKSKTQRRITKKDCLFSQIVIKPHILQKHKLLKQQKKKHLMTSNVSSLQLMS